MYIFRILLFRRNEKKNNRRIFLDAMKCEGVLRNYGDEKNRGLVMIKIIVDEIH